MPGVRAVLTAHDLPHQPLVDTVVMPGLSKTPQPALAQDRVRFVGEPVAVVVADDRARAEDAVAAVGLDIDPLPAVTSASAEDTGDGVIYRQTKRWGGDVAAAFDAADVRVEGDFTTGRATAAPMEGRGCTAAWDAGRGVLEVISSTQSPYLLRRRLSQTTGLAEHRITVTVPEVGGAFGQKIPAAAEEVAVALAARHLGARLRWVEDRRESLIAAPHAKEQAIELALALDGDGVFLGMRATIVGDAGAYSHNSASALIEPYLCANLMPGVYRLPALEAEVIAVLTNKSPVAPYRGVGWTAGHVARELLIDRAARVLELDPVELRLRNLVAADAFPWTSVTGMVYDSGSFEASMRQAASRVGYDAIRRAQQDRRGAHTSDAAPPGVLVGVGVSPYVEPCGWGSEGSLQSEWSFASHDVVRVAIAPDASVSVACGTPSQGQGHETTLAQVVSEVLGVPVSTVDISARDSDHNAMSTAGTRASRTAVVTGGAIHAAAVELRDKLAHIAAGMLECSLEDLRFAGGMISPAGDATGGVSVADVALAAHYAPTARTAVDEPHLAASRFYDPRATYSNGCIAVCVEVDLETGGVTVRDVAAVEDCGTMINPMIVEGQVAGAIAQGIGMALHESVGYDPDGQPLAQTFDDYRLPRTTEVPAISMGHETSPSPWTPLGIKGMGESGAIATPAAVAAAVADALAPYGIEVDGIPLTPPRVAALLDGAGVDPTAGRPDPGGHPTTPQREDR